MRILQINTEASTIIRILFSRGDLGSDPDILALVKEQTTQWTEMTQKLKKEEWTMLKAQLKAQEEIFKKLCVTVQARQMKDLEAFFVK